MPVDETILKKVVLLGESAVGKTSLIRRFVHDQFDDDYISTIGAKVSKKVVPVDILDQNIDVKLMVWDIIGSQGYESTQSRHIAGLNGAILVVDLTRPETVKIMEEYWLPLLSEVSGGVLPTVLFVGNKMDLVSDKEDIKDMVQNLKDLESKYCKNLDLRAKSGCGGWLLTSAKTGDNVERGFESLIRGMVAEHPSFDPLNRQMEEVVAEGIYMVSDRETTRSVMDLIVIDMPFIMMSTSKSTQILQEAIVELGFSKDRPTPQNVRDFIDLVLKMAADAGAKPETIEQYRKTWLEEVAKFG